VAAAVRGMRVGIDVEPLADIPMRTWRFFLTDGEARDCAVQPRRALWAWMIKEATYKAMASHELLNFKHIVVHGWDSGTPQVSLAVAPTQAPSVILREHFGFALAIVLVHP
jgi:4'-phosphopantetheinyl transferase EntD